LVEARTGLRKETGLAISRLDSTAWRERLEQLSRLDSAAVRPDGSPAWHEPMIREAEQNGNTFAAIWHLDQLVADRPDDWFLRARRARAWAAADQFERAAQDYDQAERPGKREEVLDFQSHCAIECITVERWTEALWYLDRLIVARPDDASLHEERAAVYGKLGREADRMAEVTRVFELGADEGLVIPRAEELGRAGRWDEAARLLARCGRTGLLSQDLARAWVIACLKAGDGAGYREACAAIIAGQGPDPAVVWSVLNAASLFAMGAEGLDDYEVPMAWCEKRLSAHPAPHAMIRHMFLSALGGLLLRARRVDEAIIRLNEGISIRAVDLPIDWAYLALAHAKKGDLGEARRSLERLRGLLADPNGSFWDLQELTLIQNEAESLLLDVGFPSDGFHGLKP
jgi:predicted Zn-dependent protease